jgi:urease accessory protein
MSGVIAGMLQPLLVPAHVLVLLAIGLLVGQQGSSALPLAVFALGVAVGLAAIAFAARQTFALNLLLAAAGSAGVLVAVAQPVPATSTLLAGASGLALGLDSPPQAISLAVAVQTLIGTGLGAWLAFVAVVAGTRGLKRLWQGIGVRVLGSWVAASAILVLALRFARGQLF